MGVIRREEKRSERKSNDGEYGSNKNRREVKGGQVKSSQVRSSQVRSRKVKNRRGSIRSEWRSSE